MVLVGNKCDMEEERAVTFEQGRKLAEQLGFAFFETSAKENVNVRSAFDKVLSLIFYLSFVGLAVDRPVN